MYPQEIDAGALIAAKRASRKRYEQTVAFYRTAGFTDREIVAAMANSREVIDAVGSRVHNTRTAANDATLPARRFRSNQER
jgi:hypothetical protein